MIPLLRTSALGPAIALWASLLGLGAGAALAQTEDEALLHKGVELRRQGDNAGALSAFEQAHAIRPTPKSRAQIALAHQALGHWLEAEAGLLEALEATDHRWITQHQTALEMALGTIRGHLGTLEIDTNLDGAAIYVNDSLVGHAPLAEGVRVVAGTAHIELRAEDGSVMARDTHVPAEGVARASIIALALRDDGLQTPGPARARGPRTSGGAATSPQDPVAAPSPREHDGHPWATAGWITLATSVPLLATGITSHIVRENNAAVWNDDMRCASEGLSREAACGRYRDRVEVAGAIAIAGYVVGGAAALTGAALLAFGGRETDPVSRSRGRLTLAAGPRGVHVRVRAAF